MDKLLPRREVEAATGLRRSFLYELMQAGRFPQPVRVGGRAVRWLESEIEQWVESRPRAGSSREGK